MEHLILQKDIDALLAWALRNKIKFHPDKCKVVKICTQVEKEMDKFPYKLGDNFLEYTEVEKDLGVQVTPKLMWNLQWDALISKAKSRLGLTKRTCHFMKDTRKRLVFYKTMVRSLFQHCAEIWRPSTKTALDKFEAVQKRAVKWIFKEDWEKYTQDLYRSKLYQLELLPIDHRFQYGDLKLFFRVINNDVCIKLADYLELVGPEEYMPGETRLRQTHKDPLYFKCTIDARVWTFKHSFFYRAHLLWNKLPLSLRLIQEKIEFDKSLKEYYLGLNKPHVLVEPD